MSKLTMCALFVMSKVGSWLCPEPSTMLANSLEHAAHCRQPSHKEEVHS